VKARRFTRHEVEKCTEKDRRATAPYPTLGHATVSERDQLREFGVYGRLILNWNTEIRLDVMNYESGVKG
jgi:hypothetical protein